VRSSPSIALSGHVDLQVGPPTADRFGAQGRRVVISRHSKMAGAADRLLHAALSFSAGLIAMVVDRYLLRARNTGSVA